MHNYNWFIVNKQNILFSFVFYFFLNSFKLIIVIWYHIVISNKNYIEFEGRKKRNMKTIDFWLLFIHRHQLSFSRKIIGINCAILNKFFKAFFLFLLKKIKQLLNIKTAQLKRIIHIHIHFLLIKKVFFVK